MLAPALAVVAALDGQQIFLHGTPGGVIPCAACHGIDGRGRSAPAIAGLTAQGVTTNLDVLATGGGDHAVMRHEARSLTGPERDAVARYIATLR